MLIVNIFYNICNLHILMFMIMALLRKHFWQYI